MKKTLLILFLLIFCIIPRASQAQSSDCTEKRIFSGIATDDTGEALPGATITIKGTTQGTVADIDGKYSIVACLGDVIVLSYVGYTDIEMIVTEANSNPSDGSTKKKKIKRIGGAKIGNTQEDLKKLYDPHVNKKKLNLKDFVKDTTFILNAKKKNVIVLDKNALKYRIKGRFGNSISYQQFHDIRLKKGARNKGYYEVELAGSRYVQQHVLVDIVNDFQWDKLGQLPKVQSEYAQGRSLNGELTWQGAEDNEVFSWGPRLIDLEYDGVSNPYSTNGNLVPVFTGSGQPAQGFDALQNMTTGFSIQNSINVTTKLGGDNYNYDHITASYKSHRRYNMLFQENDYKQHEIYLKSKFDIESIEVKPQLLYTTSQNYPFQGAVLTNLLRSTLLSPVSFDNTNALSVKDASSNSQSYMLPNGSPRSFAPNSVDNPYWLMGQNPNVNETQRLMASTSVNYEFRKYFEVVLQTGWDQVKQDNFFGVYPKAATMPEGRLTSRTDKFKQFNSKIGLRFFKNIRNRKNNYYKIDALLIYQFNHQTRLLDRTDGAGFAPTSSFDITQANTLNSTTIDQSRTIHELIINTDINEQTDKIRLDLYGGLYLSSTLDNPQFIPTVALSSDLSEVFSEMSRGSAFTKLKVFSKFARTVKEANLSYGSYHFQTTKQSILDVPNFFGQQELALPSNLKPQVNNRWELGFESTILGRYLHLDFSYFNETIEDAIYPVWQNNQYVLSNVGEVLNEGIDLGIAYEKRFNHFNLSLGAGINVSRPKVGKLYQEDRVPLSGFAEVSTNLVTGQPFGVIMGTDYQRNDKGQVIIGTDGFPIASPELQVIGNSNPNFTGVLTQTLTYEGFTLDLNWTYSRGGEQWNGTQQALDYYGRSQASAEQRTIRNYVFDGVDVNGQQNAVPVDFYNPANAINENRWVRYGETGVGSEYIQKTNWFRLNEVSLSYRYGYHHYYLDHLFLRNFSVSLYARNLFMKTKYTGVDPQSTLFGFAEGQGLDYFNAPSTRQFGIRLQIQL